MGRGRGGLTTKIHLLADELGLPVEFLLTGGEVNDYKPALELLGERQAEAVLADKGYDADAIVEYIETSAFWPMRFFTRPCSTICGEETVAKALERGLRLRHQSPRSRCRALCRGKDWSTSNTGHEYGVDLSPARSCRGRKCWESDIDFHGVDLLQIVNDFSSKTGVTPNASKEVDTPNLYGATLHISRKATWLTPELYVLLEDEEGLTAGQMHASIISRAAYDDWAKAHAAKNTLD